MSLFANAVFHVSGTRLSDLPPPMGAEIAFAGRSNAGKSSAINTLVGHTRLAFVSKTPGRTQLINFFRLASGAYLVDLPGYGYADVPESVRRDWQAMLETYLTLRTSVFGLVVIMDARRPLTELDRQMLDWFAPSGKPIHVLLTKADKLNRSEATKTLIETRQALKAWGELVTTQLFSSLKKTGIEEAEQIVGGWLSYEEPVAPPRAIKAPEKKKSPRLKGEKNRGRKLP